jgi:hypothetical protein
MQASGLGVFWMTRGSRDDGIAAVEFHATPITGYAFFRIMQLTWTRRPLRSLSPCSSSCATDAGANQRYAPFQIICVAWTGASFAIFIHDSFSVGEVVRFPLRDLGSLNNHVHPHNARCFGGQMPSPSTALRDPQERQERVAVLKFHRSFPFMLKSS